MAACPKSRLEPSSGTREAHTVPSLLPGRGRGEFEEAGPGVMRGPGGRPPVVAWSNLKAVPTPSKVEVQPQLLKASKRGKPVLR